MALLHPPAWPPYAVGILVTYYGAQMKGGAQVTDLPKVAGGPAPEAAGDSACTLPTGACAPPLPMHPGLGRAGLGSAGHQ